MGLGWDTNLHLLRHNMPTLLFGPSDSNDKTTITFVR